jgi:hypothetical protein
MRLSFVVLLSFVMLFIFCYAFYLLEDFLLDCLLDPFLPFFVLPGAEAAAGERL